MEHRAFVLLSGGIDSTTALAEAFGQISDSVIGVSIDYGQRHYKEIDAAAEICRHYNADHMVAKMAPPPKSMLTDHTAEVPNISYADIQGVSPTYVPFRNGQLLSRVAGIAQDWTNNIATREATIWFGAHAEDAHNWAYPDCTPEFIGAMANAIYVGTYHSVRLVAPFQHMSKTAIIALGHSLNVPYHLTWSCYKGEEKHCGVCPTCRARKEAFAFAHVADPTEYAE